MHYVYYRHSRGKGYREFTTKAAQLKFIRTAPLHYVITNYSV